MDVLSWDATAQLQALAARDVSAVDLLRAAIARADETARTVNAVVARDVDRALAEARAADDRRARGEPLGRLAGLPMTVKDTLDIEGLPASAGMASLQGRTAKDAAVVGRLRAEGAIVWGQTNCPVMAADWQTYNPLHGTTNNPWDAARTPGGSSGGSAAALAAGITPLEIGADIGGSLRIPASFCGVFAHKPTYGLVSQRGLVPPADHASDFDLGVVGPMARSARDLALALPIIAEAPTPVLPPARLEGLRVGLWLDEPGFIVDAEVSSVIGDFARRLGQAGAAVEPIRAPVDPRALMFAYAGLLFAVMGADLPLAERALYELFRGPAKIAVGLGAGPLSWAQGVLGYTARHREWLAADEARARLGRDVAAVFERFDVLIAPVAPIAAFPHDHSAFVRRKLVRSDGRRFLYREMLNWPALATLCGLPATAVPAGLTARGLPVGVQIIGPRSGDALTLSVAQAIDEQIGGFRAPPIG
jgi:amidase